MAKKDKNTERTYSLDEFMVKELHQMNENLAEQNRLLSEMLKYLLRTEGQKK